MNIRQRNSNTREQEIIIWVSFVVAVIHYYSISLDISDLDAVLESVKEISVDWMELGLKLGIEYSTLEKIEAERRRIDDRKREMLAAWLRGEDNAKEQSWLTLVTALEEMEKITLSEKIKKDRM